MRGFVSSRDHSPALWSGRVTTASNLLLFLASFGAQWGVGAILGLWPALEGRYNPDGYLAAFGLLLAAQAAAAVWLLTARDTKTADAAQPRL